MSDIANRFTRLLLIITSILLVLVVGLRFINFSYLSNQLAQEFSHYELQATVLGKTRVKILPTPRIIFEDVIINYNGTHVIHNGSLEFRKFFLNKLGSNNIIFRNGIVNVPALSQYFSIKLTEEKATNQRFNLRLYDTKLYFSPLYELSDIDGNLTIKNDLAEVKLQGSYNEVLTDLKLQIKKQKEDLSNITFSVEMPQTKIKLSGQSNNNTNNPRFAGDIVINAENLSSMAKLLGAESDLVDRLNVTQENLSLSSNFDIGKDEILITELTVKSQHIQNASAELLINKNVDSMYTVIVDSINLDGILGYSSLAGTSNTDVNSSNNELTRLSTSESDIESTQSSNFSATDNSSIADSNNLNATNIVAVDEYLKRFLGLILQSFKFNLSETGIDVDLAIRELKINNQPISNIEFKAEMEADKLIVRQLKADIPGQSKLMIGGEISHNTIRPQMDGDIVFTSLDAKTFAHWLGWKDYKDEYGKRIALKSDLIIITNRLSFDNFKAAWGDIASTGQIFIKNNRLGSLDILSFLSLNSLDLDQYNLNEKINSTLLKLALSDHDKTDERFAILTNDFSALRELSTIYDMDLEIGSIVLNGYEYNNVHLDMRLSRGMLDIKNLAFNSQYADLYGFLRFTIPQVRPQINANFNIDKFDYQYFEAAWPRYRDINFTAKDMLQREAARKIDTNNLNNNTAGNTPSLSLTNDNNGPLRQFIYPDLNMFSLHSIDGYVVLDIEDLKWKQYDIQNFSASINMNGGVLNLTKCEMDFADGKVELSGNLVLLTTIPSTTLNYSVNNINPERLFYIITGTPNYIDGYFSIAGNLTTSGVTFKDWRRRLQGQASFLGRQIKLSALDLDEIIKTPETNISYADKLKRLEYYKNSGQTYFDDLSGAINIDNGVASITEGKFSNRRINGVFIANYDIPTKNVFARSSMSFYPRNSTIPVIISTNTTSAFPNQKTDFDLSKLVKLITDEYNRTNRLNTPQASPNTESLLQSRN